MCDEYGTLQGFKPREVAGALRGAAAKMTLPATADSKSHTAKLIDSIPVQQCVKGTALVGACRAAQRAGSADSMHGARGHRSAAWVGSMGVT